MGTQGGKMTEMAVQPKELNREEFLAFIDARVQATLDMSVDEFMAALESGKLDPESPRVAGLAILVGARTS
jgi:hypothetical protein